MPLHTVYTPDQVRNISSSDITKSLRRSASSLFHLTGIHPHEISSCSIRPGGAMALLCAHVDSDIICLVGRWRSDEMFCYLHAQTFPLMHTFAQQMITHGSSLWPLANLSCWWRHLFSIKFLPNSRPASLRIVVPPLLFPFGPWWSLVAYGW